MRICIAAIFLLFVGVYSNADKQKNNNSVYNSAADTDNETTKLGEANLVAEEEEFEDTNSGASDVEEVVPGIDADMLTKMQNFVVENVCSMANGMFKHIASQICGPNSAGDGGLVANENWMQMDAEKWAALKQAIKQDLNELFTEGNGFVKSQLEVSDKAIHDMLEACSNQKFCSADFRKFLTTEQRLDAFIKEAQQKIGQFNAMKGEYGSWLKEMATNAKAHTVLMPSKMFTSCKDLWTMVKHQMNHSPNQQRRKRKIQDPSQVIVMVTLALVVFMALMKDGVGVFPKVFGLLSAAGPWIIGMYGYLFVSSLFRRE